MSYAEILSRLRKERGLTQSAVAEYVSRFSEKTYTYKNISSWEIGAGQPPVGQFLLLCELYGVGDIQETFRGATPEYRHMTKLNALGRRRAEEYIDLLSGNPLFTESERADSARNRHRIIRLYDVPVAAGTGSFLDSDAYEEFEADETVPGEADFAVRVSGDSMTPRFVDRQIVFVKEQQILEIGDVGIFALDGDAYVKKLGYGELISLNPRYKTITINEYNSLHIYGKVVG